MTPEFRAWLDELLDPVGKMAVRRVFGIDGVFLGGTMVALVADARIYLKTDERSRIAFRKEGSAAFIYALKTGEEVATSYWQLPDRLYDEPQTLIAWAQRAHEIALAAPANKRKRQSRLRVKKARRPARRRLRS